MADEPNESTPMRSTPEDEDEVSSESSGGSESEEQEPEQEQEVEWLVTSRQRRSTAGNRLNSLLRQEEPDDELELLFAEDDDDEVFEDEEADQSDVQMDSSSDDEDQGPAAGVDDLEGENELQRQSKAERQAKKRKLNDGIPKVFKRKSRIDATTSATITPAPRPKKKSERPSWIPTSEDAPTRASARGTTRLSKQQLHKQMVERELKRLKQLENMEKASAAKKAAAKPAMTQEDRLKEAAKVEKSNAKSLSRWEEMEQQREREQKERLLALQNRTLDGPVITWWSGMAEWVGGKLKKVGRTVVVHNEPKEKISKKRKATELDADSKAMASPPTIVVATQDQSTTVDSQGLAKPTLPTNGLPSPAKEITNIHESPTILDAHLEALPPSDSGATTDVQKTSTPPAPLQTCGTFPPQPSSAQPPSDAPNPSSVLAPPPMHGPFPPVPESGAPRPSSVLAPPPINGPFPAPQIAPNQTSYPLFKLAPPVQPTFDGSSPLPGFGYNFMAPSQSPYPGPSQPSLPSQSAPPPPPATPPPPAIEHSAINYLILSNFDETAIKEKDVQTQILFNRKFHKLPRIKHSTELCAITSYPAKYRDPSTGLPYSSSYAYKEIQRLQRGEYKWSKLVGAYVGQGTYAARGVPPRFIDALHTPQAAPKPS
ncbi:uncharacterized protein BP5553_07599 [Venustampulla echinocandica]|uniref:Vps72/YL1 C-terminal domain-containing protein n=1 Tax=Venustampulla echinocandica TaxID=2656787 RepID=A0A370TGZ3_9HELO|nr:uncharacterized protein BP5553_07599 [Venustampulla echinocandica]RDL34471.1 hypothetical protein BP5553_07599 [Venustampulla echinocandica]